MSNIRKHENGAIWGRGHRNTWAACFYMGPYGPIWAHMGPYGPIWAHMGPYGPIWAHMGPYGAHMGPYTRKFPKNPRKFHGFPWISMDFHCGATVCNGLFCFAAGCFVLQRVQRQQRWRPLKQLPWLSSSSFTGRTKGG